MSGLIRLAFVLPHLRAGGAERVVLNYLRALDRQRFEPFLILGRREGAFLDRVPADVTVVGLGGVRAHRLAPRIARELAAHRIDAAYSATDAANLALLASRWWGARRTERIVSLHTNPAAWLAEAKRPKPRRWLMRRLYPTAALAVVPTDAIAAELREIVGVAPPVAVLPNPVVERITPPPPPSNPTRIVAAGRLVEAKGFDLLIEAAALLAARGRKLELTIYGEGPLRDALVRHAAESELRCEFPGHASEGIFERADLCVVPSRREGFGNVVVEAMAAGVPVLATACPGPAGLIDDGRNGFLVEAGSSTALAEVMEALLADPARRRSVLQAAAQTARRFEVGEATRRFEQAIERLLGNHAPPEHPDPGQAVR